MTTDKTIKSKNQPKQTNVTWVDLSGETPVEKHYINGRWVAISGGGGGDSEIFDEYIDATDTQRNTALANVSNQTANTTTGKMGYKVLDHTKTFAEQVTAENTIYEIRDVFEIEDNYTIPNGVTLKFDGGKLTGNGVLTFSRTKIEGNANIGCNFAGSIDGIVQIEWFGLKKNDSTFDNASIINKVCNVFKRVSIETGTVYFSTPIICANCIYIDFNCTLQYNGTYGNKSAITIDNHTLTALLNPCNYHFYKVANGANNTLYRTISESYLLNQDENTVILRGITFECVNNSFIKIDSVMQFNENVRVSDIYAKGNCYNYYTIIDSYNANVHLRLYHDNGGWVNSDKFYMQRATNSYSSFSDGQGHYWSCAVTAIGSRASSDTNTGFSNHIFDKCSWEGFDEYCILQEGLGYSLIGGRSETSSANFVAVDKPIDSVKYPFVIGFHINKGYQVSPTDGTKFSEIPTMYLSKVFEINIKKLLKHLHPFNPSNMSETYNFCFDDEIEVGNYGYKGTNLSNAIGLNYTGLTPNVDSNNNLSFKSNNGLGFILDTRQSKYYLIKTLMSTAYISVLYLEDGNGNAISRGSSEQSAFGLPLSNSVLSWDSNVYGFNASFGSTNKNYDFYLRIPKNVGKVLIRIKSCNFTVFGSKANIKTFRDSIPTIGSTSERPSSSVSQSSSTYLWDNTKRVYAGFIYDDVDLKKQVVFDGTSWKIVGGVSIETIQPSGGMLSNTQYNFGTLDASIIFSLATPTDATVMNMYYWTFSTPADMTGLNVTLPSGITWADGNGPAIEAGTYYEIMVCNGIGTYLKL